MKINGKIVEKAVILGMGISGQAAAELAAHNGIEIIAIDEKRVEIQFDETKAANRRIQLISEFKESALPNSDLIIISPGISDVSTLGKLASSSPAPVISELNFAALFAKKPILAITGTNGKTTVTEMTEMLLKNAISAGNIGHPLSKAVEDQEVDYIVAECSSFQLEKSPHFTPSAAAILNITSDHLDRYANFASYSAAKFNIFINIANIADMIINYNLISDWREWKKGGYTSSKRGPITFSATSREADIYSEGNVISFKAVGLGTFDISSSEISGNHNIENFMAATALASRVVTSRQLNEGVKFLLKNFRISPHRQEVICDIDGVKFVNDSKATNPDAVIAALNAFGGEHNICLIAGGLDKNMDFSIIKKESTKIKKAFLIGETKKILQKSWEPEISCEICASLENAVQKSKDLASKGDIILLSPGCASMDMFANYRDRGEKFCKIIHQSAD